MYTTDDVINKYKARLNKSDSSDYDNLWRYQIEETYNKGIQDVVRRLKRGKAAENQEGDEETRDRIDDLQVLLKEKIVSVGQYFLYVDTRPLPEDYLYYKRITPFATKDNCKRKRIKSYLREEANVDVLLSDWDSQPSFDFEETFHTISGNKIRIYHNKDFKVEEALLVYYKQPRFIEFEKGKPIKLEFKDDVNELMIDEGIKIMSSDLEILNQKNLSQERIQFNN